MVLVAISFMHLEPNEYTRVRGATASHPSTPRALYTVVPAPRPIGCHHKPSRSPSETSEALQALMR